MSIAKGMFFTPFGCFSRIVMGKLGLGEIDEHATLDQSSPRVLSPDQGVMTTGA
ncbi:MULTISPECIES: hypothetical protein [unclassified Rhizobium]|uniref:hypothetical protein n=1 Tax=unclassified Rhizobium TaxID=2613769 RepID=UPI000AB47BF6|nr:MULTISPECIES: hypothetical protein [unclassified Rhizobium]MBD8685392.1 hypothetical protein [Rhizobium sp. CFBP 13644]MBD8690935.1 hypothetical protein [Rhizobium sp. CFBP 13717]